MGCYRVRVRVKADAWAMLWPRIYVHNSRVVSLADRAPSKGTVFLL